MHPLTQGTVRQSRHFSESKVFPRDGKIRIAILDTGIELCEDDWAYRSRVREVKSWLSNSGDCAHELYKGDRDLDGHGTHAGGLLLKVAPDAEIFVARVFRDRKESKGGVMAGEIHERITDVGHYTLHHPRPVN